MVAGGLHALYPGAMAKASKSTAQGVLTPEEEAKQARIISKGAGEEAYRFALYIPGAAVEALQEVVLSSGAADTCFYFALNVSGANVQALQEVVLASGEPLYCFYFARRIPGADVLALARGAARGPGGEHHLRALAKKHPTVLTPETLASLSLGVTL